MAQVNIDLSEYDMLRQSKDKAEKEVTELKEEVKKLKDNASNVVVRNRYYMPMLDYPAAANRILSNLGSIGISQMLHDAEHMAWSMRNDSFGRPVVDREIVNRLAGLIQHSLKDLLNLRASYREDATVTEIRGFDEFSESIKAKLEEEYRVDMECKKQQLAQEIESYNAKRLDVDKAVEKAEEVLNKKHEKETSKLNDKIKELEDTIKDLKNKLKEASKSSEEKLAEAMEKLHAAQVEVAKYTTSKKKLFGLF